jgi:hypothetical protein
LVRVLSNEGGRRRAPLPMAAEEGKPIESLGLRGARRMAARFRVEFVPSVRVEAW